MKNKLYFAILTVLISSSFLFAQKNIGSTPTFSNYSELDAESYLSNNTLDPIEGIWQSNDGIKYSIVKRPYITGHENDYKVIVLSNNTDIDYWTPGSSKGFIDKTAVDGVYNMDYYWATEIKEGNIIKSRLIYSTTCFGILEAGKIFTFTANLGDEQRKIILVKIFPQSNTSINSSSDSKIKSTGTGFAISPAGFIVTNYHVIENAAALKVKGINGLFSKSFSAQVIQSDSKNDIAIIKINDELFDGLGVLPYTIKSSSSNVGENIFVMGYPLTATMGEEIKLTNGIISSKSGFKGDASSYQMTAPIQPGDSGAPMFDKDGNVVGIVNAKHSEAENAGYAIKTSCLLNLIDVLPTTIKLQTYNSLKGKPLTEQVNVIKNFIYLIEVY